MRAVVLGGVITLLASLLAVLASRQSGYRSGHTDLALRPVVPATSEAAPSASPSPSPSPSPTPSPSPPRSSRAATRSPTPPRSVVTAHHEVLLAWRGTVISRITVRVTGRTAADWSVVLVLDQGVRVERFWVRDGGSARAVQQGTTVRFTGRLAAGATIVVEYQASRSGEASSQPRSCTVNGLSCR
jgi:hypothetical protein